MDARLASVDGQGTDFVSRIFWPAPAGAADRGWIVGWNVRNFITCVCCVVPATADQPSLRRLESVLGERGGP